MVGDYYPFGLTMAGISSKALQFGESKNKEQTFQGQRFDDELGLNWVQFKWRNHDPQIGRFLQIDPLAEEYVYNSTYAFSENKVTSHVELEGLEASWAGFGQHVPVDKWEGFHQGLNQTLEKGAKAQIVAAGAVLSLFFPQIAGPILAAEIFGVPSPSAPTSMVSTVTSEATVLKNAVAESNATTTLEKNIVQGSTWEDMVGVKLAEQGHTTIESQVSIKAANGVTTRIDKTSIGADGKLVLTEAKSSATAQETKAQKLAFPSIAQNGGVVVGQGKPGLPGGTVIPPTPVMIVRPSTVDATYVKPTIPPVFIPQETRN